MRKKLWIFLSLIIMLAIVRFLDHSLFYNLTKNDLLYTATIKNESFHYVFLGNSSYNNAMHVLLKTQDRVEEDVTVVAYYDIIHPIVFLVCNKGDAKYDSILWASYNSGIKKGLTKIQTYKFEYCQVTSQNDSHSFFACILGLPFDSYSSSSITEYPGGIHFSLTETTCYGLHVLKKLKTIYIYYFFFPLVFILLFGTIFNKGIYLSFLYYLEMLILFPYKYFGYNSQSYLYSSLGFGSSETFNIIISSLIWILIGVCLTIGFIKWRRNKFSTVEKVLFCFFLLLPICLRF